MTHLRTLTASLAHHARERPDHPALICQGRRTSYGELDRRSNRTGHALRESGVRPGERIAYLGKESEYYYELAFGCAKSGAVLVPVNWRLTANEIDHVLRDSGAVLLFAEREFEGVAAEVSGSLPGMRAVLAMDGPDRRASKFAAWRDRHPDTSTGIAADPADPAIQIYTSGTTGLPKGVVLPHRCFFTFLDAHIEYGLDWMVWRHDDINLIMLPGFQIAGFSWAMQGFHAGVTNVIMRMFISQEALRLIVEERVTVAGVAPAMLHMMLAEPLASKETFTSLRTVVYGGSPISESLLERCIEVIGCDFLQVYASTETGNVATCLPAKDHTPGSPLLKSAGLPTPDITLKIIDAQGKALPAGESGEICIKTPACMLEYWGQPEATAKAIVDGWFHTGDAGYLDSDGYLFVGDRIKDLIISAGQNIYPAEIENALVAHPAVSDAAVIGVPDDRWGEVALACVLLGDNQSASPRELMLFLRNHLADYKIPSQWEFVDQLPRNSTGKILRRQLRDSRWSDRARQVN